MKIIVEITTIILPALLFCVGCENEEPLLNEEPSNNISYVILDTLGVIEIDDVAVSEYLKSGSYYCSFFESNSDSTTIKLYGTDYIGADSINVLILNNKAFPVLDFLKNNSSANVDVVNQQVSQRNGGTATIVLNNKSDVTSFTKHQ